MPPNVRDMRHYVSMRSCYFKNIMCQCKAVTSKTLCVNVKIFSVTSKTLCDQQKKKFIQSMFLCVTILLSRTRTLAVVKPI